jgi:hypothetical protein
VTLGASSTTDSVGATVVLPFFLHDLPNGLDAAGSITSVPLGVEPAGIHLEIDDDSGTVALSISVTRNDDESMEDVVERAFVQAARLGTRAVIWMRRECGFVS